MTTDLFTARQKPNESQRRDVLTRGLGWASAALGVPQLTTPGAFARSLGVGDAPRQRLATMRRRAREMVGRAGLLARPHPAWLWARVGGDAMDLTLLGRALKHHDGRGLRRTALAARPPSSSLPPISTQPSPGRGGATPMELTSTTTVTKPPEEVYAFWSRLDRLPTFMAHLDEVRVTGDRAQSLEGDGAVRPAGRVGRRDDRGRTRATASPGARSKVPTSRTPGEVRFVPAPGGRGTEVHVTLTLRRCRAGRWARRSAKYFGEEPSQQLDDDLRRFKQVMETGEVIR